MKKPTIFSLFEQVFKERKEMREKKTHAGGNGMPRIIYLGLPVANKTMGLVSLGGRFCLFLLRPWPQKENVNEYAVPPLRPRERACTSGHLT